MSWTDDRVALLKQLWGEGKTAAEIAKTLGDVTRNAVIGKAHRLKLSSRVSPIQQPVKKTAKASEKQKQVQKVRKSRNVHKTNFKGKEISIEALEHGMCRWPNGDPREKEFSFCGHTVETGLPYCEEHARAAYQVSTRARKLKAEDFSQDSGSPQELEVKTAATG